MSNPVFKVEAVLDKERKRWIIMTVLCLFFSGIMFFLVGYNTGLHEVRFEWNQTVIKEPETIIIEVPEKPSSYVVLINDHEIPVKNPDVQMVRNEKTHYKDRTRIYDDGRLVAEFDGWIDYVILTNKQYNDVTRGK